MQRFLFRSAVAVGSVGMFFTNVACDLQLSPEGSRRRRMEDFVLKLQDDITNVSTAASCIPIPFCGVMCCWGGVYRAFLRWMATNFRLTNGSAGKMVAADAPACCKRATCLKRLALASPSCTASFLLLLCSK